MNLYERYPQLICCRDAIESAIKMMTETFRNGGKLLACGNGGSCADCDHIVGELMKSFMFKRKVDAAFRCKLAEIASNNDEYYVNNLEGALPAISLPSQSALISAFANDVDPELVFAQMVYGYGRPGDILICLSTSGNSKNIVAAARVAKAKGVYTLTLTGSKNSSLSEMCDTTIRVPEIETYEIQELHLPVYHYLCAKLEKAFFDTDEYSF